MALAYAWGHLAWYRTTALGQVPVMDELENLAFGETIARGTLPAEPFYRSPGYPLLLATLRTLGVPAQGLFSAALALGVVLHALNAVLAGLIAFRWFGRSAGIAAGLVFALHPVFVHYATQALDATPAVSAFLIGLAVIAPEFLHAPQERPVPWRWLVASLAWAAATILRPNYLLVWSVLPLVAAFFAWRTRRGWIVGGAVGGAVVFAVIAGWQGKISGVAGFLPWQGTYNLWVANQPGAHGRYFAQRFTPPAPLKGLNPTRAESMVLYRQETGQAPTDIAALNAHWRRRFWERVQQDPLGWLAQLTRKSYALINNWEQYNNKTYAFHQQRSPWLRWNPIGWGLVLCLAVIGAVRLRVVAPRAGAVLALVTLALAGSAVLFFVSARFRLPLAALGIILSGGAITGIGFLKTLAPRRRLALAGALALTSAIAYSNFDDVKQRRTYVEDYALAAGAAFTLGDYTTAWTEASNALQLEPSHPNAQRTAVSAYFNALVLDGRGPATEARWLEICRKFLADTAEADLATRELRALAVVALWRAGEHAAALAAWRQFGAVPSAVAARLLIGDRSVVPDDLARAPLRAWDEPLVRLATSRLGIAHPQGGATGDARRATEVVALVFGGPDPRAP